MEDIIEGLGLEPLVYSGQLSDITDDVVDIWGYFGNGVGIRRGRDGRYVDPIDRGGGLGYAQMARHDTGTTAYVEHLG